MSSDQLKSDWTYDTSSTGMLFACEGAEEEYDVACGFGRGVGQGDRRRGDIPIVIVGIG